MAMILRSTPEEMHASLATKETAKVAWDTIKIQRVGVERVREANAQKLRKEFEAISFRDGETWMSSPCASQGSSVLSAHSGTHLKR